MKTLAELDAEKVQLQQVINETRAIANDRATRAYRVQIVGTQLALGKVGRSELAAAQKDLEASVEALIQLQMLEASMVELEDSITITRGRERATYCQSVKENFDAAHAAYVAGSKTLLVQFLELHREHNKYLGLTARPLLAPGEYQIHLPACMSWADSSTFRTGELVAKGDLK